MSCFKKSDECRFDLPQPMTKTDIEFSEKIKDWLQIFHSTEANKNVQSFQIYPERSLGDEYLNVHSKSFSDLLGFNNNIKIADIQQIFYCTLYSFKDQIPEENFEFLNVCTTLTRRFERMEKEMEDNDIGEGFKEDFRRGIGTLLSGIRAHVSSNVIMANMASLLLLIDTRFMFSHNFSNIFVSLLQDHLEGKESQFRIQIPKGDCKEVKERWSDQNVNDVIMRTNELENICLYETQMWFERIHMTITTRKKRDKEKETKETIMYRSCDEIKYGTILFFQEEHPGYNKVCLKKEKRNLYQEFTDSKIPT